MRGPAALGRLLAVLLLCGCVSRPSGPVGPVVSPTGIVFEGGIPPRETRASQTATLYLRSALPDRALERALEGIAADSTNPIHFFLAGVAHARLGQYASADSMFTAAQSIYPAYQLDIEPEREAAWGQAFNDGLQAYEEGDVTRTIDIWAGATLMFDLRPEAHRNLASLLITEGRYPEAIEAFEGALVGLGKVPVARLLTLEETRDREASRSELEEDLAPIYLITGMFAEAEPLLRRQLEREPDNVELRAELAAALTGQGREEEARVVYETLLEEPTLESTELFNLGTGLFRSGEYAQAAEAFARLTTIHPESRDAWFNYVNSLFAAESWTELQSAGPRLIAVDPLGENARLITARAQLESGDRQGALESLRGAEQLPVFLESLRMQRSGAATTIIGDLTGNMADAGTAVTVRFVFYDDAAQEIGTTTVTLAAPPTGESVDFEVRFEGVASAYRYEPT
ncbi:MAG: tetratricopeptide repeat protein [Longimicrobiales bacterium]